MPGVKVSVEGGRVRRVLLDRPEKRNALDPSMLTALETAFPADPAPSERVALLSASGPVFCAGIDLSGFSDGESLIEAAFAAIERYPLPVLAVVGGDAVAGGAELAFHCDVVVAAESARFSMPLARIGLTPPWPFVLKLVEVVGGPLAREMLLLGDAVPAARLAAVGAIARAVPACKLEGETQSLVEVVGGLAPLSLRAMKRALVRAGEARTHLAHGDVDDLARTAGSSRDAVEGIRARLEKRPASFEGR